MLYKRKAELDVALYLPRVERAVEKAEFDRPLGEESVEVKSTIPAVIIVSVAGVRCAVIVPDHFEVIFRLRFLLVQLFQVCCGCLLAVIDVTVLIIHLQGFVDHVLVVGEEV